MPGLTAAELAARVGVTAEHVEELRAAGVLAAAGDPDAPYELEDTNRVVLADSLVASGFPLADIAAAVEDGRLTFGFVGDLFTEPVDYVPGTTMAEFVAANGVPMELVRQVHTRFGLPQPAEDDPIRADEAKYMPLAAMALGAGFEDAALAHFSRVMGENLRRLAEAQVHFYTSSIVGGMIENGVAPLRAWELSTVMGREMRPMFRELLLWVYERHQEAYILEDVVEHMENALRGQTPSRERVRDQAIAFLDLSGFTRLTEERGDQAAAELAATLADLVQDASTPHGGLPVKLLGDGVMFHFPGAGAAVECALELVERAPAEGLPPAHVGVSVGPVVVRDGDYFGRTVNVAARVADKAGPHEVFVTDEVVASAAGAARFSSVGDFELKGIAGALTLHRAERPEF
ncbi:MAG TPA: adenylate/guanylate cyclase domain-containing protein [Actinomycetota bacterium]|nr:adenylate/guanylate cyclase domain-containing protein [Actinomycetota bacterium]